MLVSFKSNFFLSDMIISLAKKEATCLAFFFSLVTKVIENVMVRHVMHCLWYVIQDKFGERREKKVTDCHGNKCPYFILLLLSALLPV